MPRPAKSFGPFASDAVNGHFSRIETILVQTTGILFSNCVFLVYSLPDNKPIKVGRFLGCGGEKQELNHCLFQMSLLEYVITQTEIITHSETQKIVKILLG